MWITCGLPQSSVLGFTLFILYITSICELAIDEQIVTYADDTCLNFSGVSWDKFKIKGMREFKKIIDYLNSKKHSTNCEKQILLITQLIKMKRTLIF